MLDVDLEKYIWFNFSKTKGSVKLKGTVTSQISFFVSRFLQNQN